MGLCRWRIAGVRFLNGLLHGVQLRVGRERVGVSRRPFWILVEFPAPKSKPCVHFRKKKSSTIFGVDRRGRFKEG